MAPEQVIAANPNSTPKMSFNASDLKTVSDVTSFHNIKLKSEESFRPRASLSSMSNPVNFTQPKKLAVPTLNRDSGHTEIQIM